MCITPFQAMYPFDWFCESMSSCMKSSYEAPQALIYLPSSEDTRDDIDQKISQRIQELSVRYNYLYQDPEMEIWFRRQCRDW